VQPGSLLTTLVRRDPLLLRFDIPDGDAANLTTGMTARFAVRGAPVTHDARIISVGESADPNSRMVAVTAEVVSDDASLRPGAFAEVTIPVGESRHAAVIPQTAVRPSERGFLAYIVDGGKARERILVLGLRTADGLVEVTNGLAIGDSLVVRGAEALREGASVKIVANTSGPPGARAPGDAVSPMGGHVEPAVAAPGSRPS